MTNIVTADSSGNIGCASPIESILKGVSEALVKKASLTYNPTTGALKIVVDDIAGGSASSSVTLPGDFAGVSAWTSGTTETLVLGSDGKLYLANPAGAPATHNPTAKTNDVDWFGPFSSVNAMLEYALSGDSFLAGSSAATTASATPPTSPALGDTWWTTSATAAPYAKNTMYSYNGTSWVYVAGHPETVATSTGVRDAALGTGTQFDDIDLSAHSDGMNATTTADGIVVPETGVYHVEATITPGSIFTTHEATDGGVAFYALGIRVNGVMLSQTNGMVFINSLGSHITSTTLGASCNAFLTTNCNAGDVISPTIYVTGLTLSYGMTIKVARVG